MSPEDGVLTECSSAGRSSSILPFVGPPAVAEVIVASTAQALSDQGGLSVALAGGQVRRVVVECMTHACAWLVALSVYLFNRSPLGGRRGSEFAHFGRQSCACETSVRVLTTGTPRRLHVVLGHGYVVGGAGAGLSASERALALVLDSALCPSADRAPALAGQHLGMWQRSVGRRLWGLSPWLEPS